MKQPVKFFLTDIFSYKVLSSVFIYTSFSFLAIYKPQKYLID